MVRAHVEAGALTGVAARRPRRHPLAPPVEAVRLGLYALARLGVYEPLAAAVVDADGQPVSRWWPVAYALQRVGDPRAAPALLALALDPGPLHRVVRGARAGRGQGDAAVGSCDPRSSRSSRATRR